MCLTLKRGTLFLCFVMYACLESGINSKRYLGDWFLIILKKRLSFLYHHCCCKDSKPSYWQSFFLKLSLIVPVTVSPLLYWIKLNLSILVKTTTPWCTTNSTMNSPCFPKCSITYSQSSVNTTGKLELIGKMLYVLSQD